jgi:CheY-like chemotaxis protein/HD-like signal output (HDOD) protein
MSTILVVDDMAVIREPIAAALRSAGYKTLCASGGMEALSLMRSSDTDLVLLDLSMPGMDGLAVLQAMRQDPRLTQTQVILLTASAEKEHVLKAAKWGVQDYVLKSRFSLSELLTRVKRRMPAEKNAAAPTAGSDATAEAKDGALSPPLPPVAGAAAKGRIVPLLTREQCFQRAEKALQARTLSGVVGQVVSLAASPRGDMSQLAGLISRDPMLSARVLQAANSAGYVSTRGVVTTLPEAVRQIGCSTVRDIATALGVFDAMPPCGPDGFNPIRCWQHCFAVATLCERLAGPEGKGQAYLVGLCHDLGEILFQTHFGSEYRQVIEAQATSGLHRDEIERQMLGMKHGELVVAILRCLGLPDEIRQPIEEFHTLGMAGRGARSIVRLLRIADLFANGLQLASSNDAPVAPVSRGECRAVCGSDHPSPPDGAALRGEIYTLTTMLGRLSTRDGDPLLASQLTQKTTRIWLAREPFFSSFDPIQATLESLAQVSVSDALPPPEELPALNAVVVISQGTSHAGYSAADLEKALAGSDLPCLWIVGRIDDSSAPADRFIPTAWPVALSRLQQFVEDL